MWLNCHSWFSLRYGILQPSDIVALYAEAGSEKRDSGNEVSGLLSLLPGAWKHRRPLTAGTDNPLAPVLALTDINTVSGIPDFFREAKKAGLPVAGGVDFRNGDRQLYVALAMNLNGFEEMNRWLSQHLMDKKPLPPVAPPFSNCLVIYPWQQVNAVAFNHALREFEFVGLRPTDLKKLPFSPWKNNSEKLVAMATASFRNKADFNAHRLLRCIDHNCLLSRLPANACGDLSDTYRNADALWYAYRDYPELLRHAAGLLTRCVYAPEFGVNQNKRSFTGDKDEDFRYMTALAYEGLLYRYPKYDFAVKERLEKEMRTIYELGFTAYFLISWDIARYARSRGFFHVGRGSGANSMVAYCLRITDVDPIDLDLYFERFINPYRTSPPDFDLDFSWRDRDEVTRYIFERHGREHTALLATYSTFQTQAVLRELGKVFGLPKDEIDALTDKPSRRLPENRGADEVKTLVLNYARRLHGMPNYRSIHAGGVLISERPIYCYSATDLPPKGFPTVQFSMLEAEDLGLHKFDILSQRGLGHIRDTVEIVQQNRGEQIDVHRIHAFKEDPAISRLISSGRTMGCFYVESPAMRQLLRKLHCRDYPTLVAASSVIRPGVSSSGMMRTYIERHIDPQARKQAHPVLLELMPDTYGVMVYQEDVIRVAHHFAGLGLDESDVLRRGMSGKFRSREEFRRVQERWFESCRSKGHPDELATEVWKQVESFAGYSFAKGHSASYAVESYQSLYLKAYYPLEFYTAVINNYGGFYRTAFYVHAARMCGAQVEAPCVNMSVAACRLEGKTLWLGLAMISGLESKLVQSLLQEREQGGVYGGLADFVARVACTLEQMKLLIRIGAFRFSGHSRKELMWQAHWLLNKEKTVPAAQQLFAEKPKPLILPALHNHPLEDAFEQLELLGFPLCDPFSLVDPSRNIDRWPGRVNLEAYGSGARVSCAGYLVAVKPTRTRKGEEMNFGTWLDRNGHFFDTVHFPPAVRAWPFRGRGVYLMSGKVHEDFGVYSLEVDRMERQPYCEDPRYG